MKIRVSESAMSFQDRRLTERRNVYSSALLSIPRRKTVHSCGMRDLSQTGLGLRLNGLPLLPDEFNLSLDGFRSTLVCRLIWRDGDFAGVSFKLATLDS